MGALRAWLLVCLDPIHLWSTHCQIRYWCLDGSSKMLSWYRCSKSTTHWLGRRDGSRVDTYCGTSHFWVVASQSGVGYHDSYRNDFGFLIAIWVWETSRSSSTYPHVIRLTCHHPMKHAKAKQTRNNNGNRGWEMFNSWIAPDTVTSHADWEKVIEVGRYYRVITLEFAWRRR